MILSQNINREIVQKDIGNYNFPESYDVIVAGLGTAGAIAAIVAAKKGLRVLGIDRMNCMGGMGTAGNVNSYYFGSTGGLFEELDKKANELVLDEKIYTKSRAYNIDAKKYVLEQEAAGLGVVLCYESSITGVYLEGNQIKGINWIGPEGDKTAGCKILIDCTGDAEVCNMAGCRTHLGRQLDGRTQPFTSVRVFVSANKIGWDNYDSGCMDQSNAEELSKTIILSHASHLEDNYTDTQQMLYLAPLIGIREGRLIEGEETITLSDFLSDKVTDKPLFYAYADIDKHGRDHAFESEALQDWFIASNLGAVNVSIPVPLGAMIPKGFEGIIVAGRCMSFDHDISTCARMNRDMQKSGEAAATAAWLSIEKGLPLKNIPYDELILRLKETGCFDILNNQGYQFANPRDRSQDHKIEWLTDVEAIRKGLSSNRPGIAIWSSKRLGGAIREHLKSWINNEEGEELKKHSAFALALMGDESAIPVLREIVRERDSFVLQDCRKNNQMRGYAAIYLLGKLRDEKIVEELKEIILSPNEFERPLYKKKDESLVNPSIQTKYNEIYFQFFSQTVIALLKIGQSHKALRNEIGTALRKAVSDEDYIRNITEKEPGSYEYSMAENIRTVVECELNSWHV